MADIMISNHEIANITRDIRIACDTAMNTVNGERYNNDGWRLMVHSAYCWKKKGAEGSVPLYLFM